VPDNPASVEPIGFPIPTAPRPTDDDLETQVHEGIVQATDGCPVEPDGTCPHGHPSWLVNMEIL